MTRRHPASGEAAALPKMVCKKCGVREWPNGLLRLGTAYAGNFEEQRLVCSECFGDVLPDPPVNCTIPEGVFQQIRKENPVIVGLEHEARCKRGEGEPARFLISERKRKEEGRS